jgi:hypothetical protein
VSDGRPGPSGDRVAGLDVERLPPDPSALIGALGRALAAVHDGGTHGGIDGAIELPELRPADALGVVERAVAAGWRAPDRSPYAAVEPGRLLDVLRDGLDRVVERSTGAVPTIGRATFANLVLPEPDADAPVSTSANLTFRARRPAPAPTFVDHGEAARSDPYRDLAVAAADVVATFGPGAVLGLTAAYVEARPAIEPLDPIRLDWWSIVAAVTGGARR